jgi:hypothetical protein
VTRGRLCESMDLALRCAVVDVTCAAVACSNVHAMSEAWSCQCSIPQSVTHSSCKHWSLQPFNYKSTVLASAAHVCVQEGGALSSLIQRTAEVYPRSWMA